MQTLRQIIAAGYVDLLSGRQVPACVKLGGDYPYLKRLLGLTISWMIPSIYSQAFWDDNVREFVDWSSRRTKESDALLQGRLPVCSAGRGCVGPPMFEWDDRHDVVVCILHCLMAFGKLLCAFLQRIVPVDRRPIVNGILKVASTGWKLGSRCAVDGEETQRLFTAWPFIAKALGLVDSPADKAILQMHAFFRKEYRTYQEDKTLPELAVTAAISFRMEIAPQSRSSYLYLMEHDFPYLLKEKYPWGPVLYCNDLTETWNYLLKDIYMSRTNRGGGAVEGDDPHLQKQAEVLQQTLLGSFVYLHSEIQISGRPREGGCSNASLLECA